MTSLPDWLPEALNYERDYGGSWDNFLTDSYGLFEADLIKARPKYRGKKVILSAHYPDLGDKKHGSYWHVVSTGDGASEDSKQPDIARMEVVGWIRPILENCPDEDLLEWEEERSRQKRRSDKRIVVWCKKHGFAIILKELNHVYVLITAFTVTYNGTRRKLQAGYDKWLERQTPLS